MQRPDRMDKTPSGEPPVVLPEPAAGDHEQEQYERLRFGVAFRDLGCYGVASSTEHQATFTSYLLSAAKILPSLLSKAKSSHVSILQHFDGLVLPGEMLLVLGRPGSGCSTFLKTLAGDTHGFQIHDRAIIRYNCELMTSTLVPFAIDSYSSRPNSFNLTRLYHSNSVSGYAPTLQGRVHVPR